MPTANKSPRKFEKVFDTQKAKYWQGLQAWQEKAEGKNTDANLANNATTLIDYFDDPDYSDSDSDVEYEEEEDTVPR